MLSGFYPERSTKMRIKNRITSAIKWKKYEGAFKINYRILKERSIILKNIYNFL